LTKYCAREAVKINPTKFFLVHVNHSAFLFWKIIFPHFGLA